MFRYKLEVARGASVVGKSQLHEMAQRWPDITRAIPAIAAAARGSVVSWRYFDAEREVGHLEPYAAERAGRDPDPGCDKPTDVGSDWVERVGYDSTGRFVLRECEAGFGWSEVVVYDGDESESYWYGPVLTGQQEAVELGVVWVARQRWSDGALVSQVRFDPPEEETGWIRHWRQDEFGYGAVGELASVVRLDYYAPSGDPPDRTEQRLHRAASGTLEWIEEITFGGGAVVYGVRPEGYGRPPQPRGEASERYRRALRRHVVSWARATWPPDQRVVGIVVVTSERGTLSPDGVLVSGEALQRLLAEDPGDPLGAWMVGEHDLWGVDEIREMLTDDERADEAATVAELDDKPEWIWDLLREVCRDLTDEDWSDLLGGDDVIVCLADASDSGAAEFFARDESRLAQHRARGWIP